MKLTFWGAAQTVTGSMHLLEADGKRILLDCGMYQGRRKEAEERNRNLPFPAASIDAVVLSHAHIDHSGNLPTLVKQGYKGPIYTTPATVDLCDPMLKDTAHIQQKDAEFTAKRLAKRHVKDEVPVPPLYDSADAERTLELMRPVPYHHPTPLEAGLTYQSFEAGHMLGSSAVRVERDGFRLLFSGDVGRRRLPIIRDPERMAPADYLIMESTYGNRLHKDPDRVADKLTAVVTRTAARGGRIIVPAFAVGRTQQLVVLLHELSDQRRIPNIPIFVDSPLAVNVTDVFRAHTEDFDEETRVYLSNGDDPFGFKRLTYVREAAESKKLNELHGPYVVISASGMCEAGRILHHLRNNIENPRNTVLITGFQAENTLGRKLVDGMEEVRIFGEPMRLRSEVVTINELSGHADQRELLEWMEPVTPGLKHVFLVHGEISQAEALKKAIEEKYRLQVTIPARGQSFALESSN